VVVDCKKRELPISSVAHQIGRNSGELGPATDRTSGKIAEEFQEREDRSSIRAVHQKRFLEANIGPA
jgi:hypothetical protein